LKGRKGWKEEKERKEGRKGWKEGRCLEKVAQEGKVFFADFRVLQQLFA
jgi:hypothetical protein